MYECKRSYIEKMHTYHTNGISKYPNLSITIVSEKAGASRYNTNEKFYTILRNTAPITRSWQLSKVVILQTHRKHTCIVILLPCVMHTSHKEFKRKKKTNHSRTTSSFAFFENK